MKVDDFDTLEDFVAAVKAVELEPLDHFSVLARVYLVQQLRDVAEKLGLASGSDDEHAWDAEVVSRGHRSRHNLAEAIVAHSDGEARERMLIQAERTMVFADVSYRLLGYRDDAVVTNWTAARLRRHIFQGLKIAEADELFKKDVLSEPPPRVPRLDGIWFNTHHNRVTMIFGVSRVLSTPNGEFGGFFVARVPAKVELMLDLGLVEVSFPEFAETSTGHLPEGTYTSFPHRAFNLTSSVLSKVRSLLPGDFGMKRVNGNNVFLYLEQHKEADDLGWDIDRPDGSELNTSQRRHLPLKKVLTAFQEELAAQCTVRKKEDPLADVNLYELFRTIKAESHTASMMLSAKIGSRDGEVKLTGFFGTLEEPRDPVFRFLRSGYSFGALENFRQAVAASQDPDLKLRDLFSVDSLPDIE